MGEMTAAGRFAGDAMPTTPEARIERLLTIAAGVFGVTVEDMGPVTRNGCGFGGTMSPRFQARYAALVIGVRLGVASRMQILHAMGIEHKRSSSSATTEERFMTRAAGDAQLAARVDRLKRLYLGAPARVSPTAIAPSANPVGGYGPRGVSRKKLVELHKLGWKPDRLARQWGLSEAELMVIITKGGGK